MVTHSFRALWPALLVACAVLGTSAFVAAERPADVPRLRALVVIVDGLRPDFITAERTPNLMALGRRGVIGRAHHSMVPTVTRVNASSLITGTGPSSHGVLDNVIYLPAVDRARALNTGDGEVMRHADSVLDGRLLGATSLPELLAPHGHRVVVASSGSSGSAYLLAGAGRAPVLHSTMIMPQALEAAVVRRLGAFDPLQEGAPNLRANARAVDALLQMGVDSLDATVALLWLSDPDHTAHRAGLGSALTDSAIRAVDREFGRVIAGLQSRGLTDSVTVLVVSDHGFSTQAGTDAPLRQVLAPFREDIVEAGGAVHILRGGESRRRDIVRALQASPAVGAVFTRGDSARALQGQDEGTLSFASIGWNHARNPEVMFSANWSHDRNRDGVAGTTALPGAAGHGTTSPYDIRATFLVAGRGVRRGDSTFVPTANRDIAPTVLTLLGLPVPGTMTGRPLRELMRDGPALRSVNVTRSEVTATAASGYSVTLYRSSVGSVDYVDSTVVRRRTGR